MDSIILSLAIKLYKKILSFITDYQSDIFGTGTRNIYVGADDDNKPAGYEMWTTSSGTYTMTASDDRQLKNLTIDENCSLTADTPYLFLYVRDTLRIRKGGKLHLDARGSNSYTFSPFLPTPSVGDSASKSTNAYTAACLRMFLSGRDVRTTLDLNVSGGNAMQSRLSGGGTVGGGGGLVCVFHKKDKLQAQFESNGNITDCPDSFICANGGATGATGGGMLFVFARNIILECNDSQEIHGTISANGGDGLGLISYMNQNPGNQNIFGQTSPAFGGGGVVHHVGLDVI